VFTLDDDEWTIATQLPDPRQHLAATSDGAGRVWVLGGRVEGLDSNLGRVTLIEGTQTTELGELPTPRGGVAAFFAPDVGACLTGGEAPGVAYQAVECMDTEGDLTTLPEMRIGRHGHGAGVVDGIAYVVLGGPAPGLSAHASVEALDLEGIGD
jgi:hypothetical protein